MEEKEFRQKVMPLQRLMYSVALRMGVPPDDAADAVQETQMRLWRSRRGIPDDDIGLKSYCMAVLRNQCITWYRRHKEAESLEAVPEVEASVTDETVEVGDTRFHIERLIDSLPQGQREVIRLSGFGELDNSEISEATGLSQVNVRQLLSRARRRLREIFDKNP